MLGPGSPGIQASKFACFASQIQSGLGLQPPCPPAGVVYGHPMHHVGMHASMPPIGYQPGAAPPPGMTRTPKEDTSLSAVTQRFLALLLKAHGGELDLNQAASELGVPKRRMYDITNVMEGVGLIEKKTKNIIKWKSNEEGADVAALREEVEALARLEEEIDEHELIMHNSLRALAEDEENCRLAYILQDDLTSLPSFANDTMFFIRAPTGTNLEVVDPDCEYDSLQRRLYQIYIKSKNGPIEILQLQHGYPPRRMEDLEYIEDVDDEPAERHGPGHGHGNGHAHAHAQGGPGPASHLMPDLNHAYFHVIQNALAAQTQTSAPAQAPHPAYIYPGAPPQQAQHQVIKAESGAMHPSPRAHPYAVQAKHDTGLRSIQPKVPIQKLSQPGPASSPAAQAKSAVAAGAGPYAYTYPGGLMASAAEPGLTPLAAKGSAPAAASAHLTSLRQCSIKDMVAMVSEMAPGAGKFETPPGMQFVSAASTELSSVDNFDTGHLLEYEGASPLHGGALDAEYATNYLFSLDDTEGVGDLYMP